MTKLTVEFRDATAEALPFEIRLGRTNRGNRVGLDALIAAFEDEATEAVARLALDMQCPD